MQDQDELQAKEFLSRVEIITMKKDLRKLREIDALKERNKIVKGIMAEEDKKTQDNAKLQEVKEKFERERVLNENLVQEMEAEKQLKSYATEEERQKIFILESERLELDKKTKEDRARKEPELVMKKNDLNLEKKKIEERLRATKSHEENMEGEENVISEKERTTNLPSEKEGMEKRRQELEDERQEIEKTRWAIEKELSDKNKEIEAVDSDYKKMIEEENGLKQKITDIDKQLRAIYSQIISRVREAKIKEEEEKKTAQSEVAKIQSKEMEQIQRQQRAKPLSAASPEKAFLKEMPASAKQKMQKQTEDEEQKRQKFLQDIEAKASEEKTKNN